MRRLLWFLTDQLIIPAQFDEGNPNTEGEDLARTLPIVRKNFKEEEISILIGKPIFSGNLTWLGR